VPRWPASEDLPDDAEAVRPTVGGSDDVASPDAAPPALGGPAPSPADPSGLPAPTAARGADDHFVPPPPPPLPRLDTIAKAAWIAVLGAPLLLLAAVVFRIDVTGTRGLVLVGAFVAGFVTLVARMRDDDEDSGWHDGAVV
jgi:hypothetical protein